MIKHVLVLMLIITGSHTASAAIDYSEVPGYMLFPLEQNKVRLVSMFTRVNNEANAEAKYILENVSGRSVSINIGFPCLNSKLEREYIFKAKVDGKEVTPKNIDYSIPADMRDKIGWANDYKTRYSSLLTWEVTFKKDERKEIEVFFPTQWGSDHECAPLCMSFIYINKPGRLWNGPIDKAEYYIEISNFYSKLLDSGEVRIVAKPDGYNLDNNKIIKWDFTNWIPEENIYVEFKKPIDKDSPEYSEVIKTVKFELIYFRNKNHFVGDKELYTTDNLRYEGIKEDDDHDRFFVQVLRNEIFARHGRQFKSKDLQEVFNYQDWYKPNPNYSDDMLNDIERKNIQFILDYEKKKSWR